MIDFLGLVLAHFKLQLGISELRKNNQEVSLLAVCEEGVAYVAVVQWDSLPNHLEHSARESFVDFSIFSFLKLYTFKIFLQEENSFVW